MRAALLVVVGLLAATPALAEDVGVPVTVRVVDSETEEPVQTAVVRHPSEQDRHRVNTETGAWMASVLYLPNGDELIFTKGMQLEFEVSAPGYENTRVSYTVRKRKNVITVPLAKMQLDMSDEDPEDIVIQFGRDKPID